MDKSIELDDTLLKEAQAATGEPSEREAVERVLKRFLEGRKKHGDLLALVGKIEFYEGYDPKSLRLPRE